MSDLAFAIVIAVASFAEAWIEIAYPSLSAAPAIVASFAEAWIEIDLTKLSCDKLTSPPSRRRGLKFEMLIQEIALLLVASFAEAWIEIRMKANLR